MKTNKILLSVVSIISAIAVVLGVMNLYPIPLF